MISWQAKALNLFLKQTVKRSIENTKDANKLRLQMRALDKFSFGTSSKIARSQSMRAGILCDDIKLKFSNSKTKLLYLHGGAFVFKTPAMHNNFIARLAEPLDLHAIVPDYPLAPEHPFPAALDCCYIIYKSLLDSGTAAEDIILAGDSAGGNLVLALLHRAKRDGLPMPKCGVLLSPNADMTQSGMSAVENRYSDALFSLEVMLHCRNLYLAGGNNDLHNDEISPLFGDFTGFPPFMFHAGSTELMRDDSTRLAAFMQEKGVDAHVQIWREMPHVFPLFEQLPESKAALIQIVDFIKKHQNKP
ncbi:alpha/beta hydrolase [Moritella sp. Urea-trap-13]|uniref:alpha/beta hydrolase n=1 Tax=Moritella sp. Urea-trap-13 TaxID=2058327 RepID=UPI000C340006|nr:alpha/beta hydrolase [Moritella sp. Urea-trap-13]PKH06588.1 alpha/beta hydrolase [Moritella sp. Urea-trap-13]